MSMYPPLALPDYGFSEVPGDWQETVLKGRGSVRQVIEHLSAAVPSSKGTYSAASSVLQPVLDFYQTCRGAAVSFDFYSWDPYRLWTALACGTGDGTALIFPGPVSWVCLNGDTPAVTVAGVAKTIGSVCCVGYQNLLAWSEDLTQQPGVNLLTVNQASVETDTTGFASQVGSTFVKDGTNKLVGSNSLKVTFPGSAPNEDVYASAIPCLASTTYTCSAWVYATGSAIGKPLIAWLRSGPYNTILASGAQIALTAGWQRITVTGTTLAGESTMMFQILTAATWTGPIWIDCWQAELGSQATGWVLPGTPRNLLSANQSDIETDTTGFQASNSATLTKDTTRSIHSTASLKCVTGNLTGVEGLYTMTGTGAIPCIPSMPYAGSAWVYPTTNAQLDLRIRWYDASGASLQVNDNYFVPTPNVWTRVSATATGPSNAAYVTVGIMTGSQALATWWTDCLQLELGSAATGWVVGGSVPTYGWAPVSGAAVTCTPQQADPDGGTRAWRIQTSGGNDAAKFQQRGLTGLDLIGAWIMNNGPSTLVFGNGLISINVVPGTWQKVTLAGTLASGAMVFAATVAGNSLDFNLYQPSAHDNDGIVPLDTNWRYIPTGAAAITADAKGRARVVFQPGQAPTAGQAVALTCTGRGLYHCAFDGPPLSVQIPDVRRYGVQVSVVAAA